MPDQTPQTDALYLVDGTSQLYRAYFAIRGLTTADGLPTNALFGFTTMLRKLIREEGPRRIAVCFDPPGPVFRHDRFPDYKANRPPAPEDMNRQSPYARQICEVLGVPVVEVPGYEADDVIATYATRATAAGLRTVIVASDKDLLQLVDDSVSVFNPSKNIRLDPDAVTEHFGVPPSRVRDVLGLMGDSIDNIPGVPGVGEKTAMTLVSTHGDLDAIRARAERFVEAYDARDRLVDSLASLNEADEVDDDLAETVERTIGELSTTLRRAADGDPEREMAERWSALADLADSIDPVQRGVAGKVAIRPLRSLRRDAKALDKGSSKRIWYAIVENGEQAELSRELATVDREVPVERTIEDLVLGEIDLERSLTLFRTLEFQAIVTEFEEDDATPARRGGTGSGEIEAQAREDRVIEDAGQLDELLDACRRAGSCGLVVIPGGADPLDDRPAGLAVSHVESEASYLPLQATYLGGPTPVDPERVRDFLCALAAGDLRVVAHDTKTTFHRLSTWWNEVPGSPFDTMVAAFLLDPGRSRFDLEGLTRELLADELAPWSEIAGTGAKARPAAEIDVERLASWAGPRASALPGLADRLSSRLEENGLRKLYDEVDGPLLPVLARMERRGIRVDVDYLARMSDEMDQSLDRDRARIHELAGEEFNVDSPKQLREVLFDKLGLKPGRKTAKSKVASTDAQTLEELSDEHEIARVLLDYRELHKLKGTYVDALPKLVREDGRVHTQYQPTGAATGRLSSSDPNLQNIPVRSEAGRKIRHAFVPDEGCRFLAADYSQVELRVLAHLCDDERLIEAFRAGEDIHRYTAARVAGTAPDLVTDEMRRRAKAVNFGILYGMSEIRLAREQGMKRTDARRFIQTYFERFARVREYIDSTRESALRDAAVRTLFGRVRYFPELHQKVNRAVQERALRAAVNTTIQGTAADLMKMAMLRVDERLEREGLRAAILLQVHDELLLEVPDDEMDQVTVLVREEMEGVEELRVPLAVDCKVGASWFEAT